MKDSGNVIRFRNPDDMIFLTGHDLSTIKRKIRLAELAGTLWYLLCQRGAVSWIRQQSLLPVHTPAASAPSSDKYPHCGKGLSERLIGLCGDKTP